MRHLVVAVGLFFALSGVTQACMCLLPQTEEQKRDFARSIAERAVAVAEIELVEETDNSAMKPALYRVIRTYAGSVPDSFRAYERFSTLEGSGIVGVAFSDCDAAPAAGVREIVVLYDPRTSDAASPPDRRGQTAIGDLQLWSTCERLFFEQQGGLALVIEEARKLGKIAR